MSAKLRDRRLFAVVVVLFAATTWLNWTAESGSNPSPFTTVAMLEQVQNK